MTSLTRLAPQLQSAMAGDALKIIVGYSIEITNYANYNYAITVTVHLFVRALPGN